MSDEVEWIRSTKTWALLHAAKVGHPTVEHHLRTALLMGKVHARAGMATIKLRGRDGGQRKLTDWEVPSEVWQGEFENSRFDLNSDTYNTGDYGVSLGSVKLRGMTFNKAEMIEWFEIEDEPIPSLAPNGDKGKGGRTPKSDEWNRTLAALIVYAQSGAGVTPGAQPGEVYTAALDYAASLGMEGDGISIDRCRPGIYQAQALIKKVEDEAAAKASGGG